MFYAMGRCWPSTNLGFDQSGLVHTHVRRTAQAQCMCACLDCCRAGQVLGRPLVWPERPTTHDAHAQMLRSLMHYQTTNTISASTVTQTVDVSVAAQESAYPSPAQTSSISSEPVTTIPSVEITTGYSSASVQIIFEDAQVSEPPSSTPVFSEEAICSKGKENLPPIQPNPLSGTSNKFCLLANLTDETQKGGGYPLRDRKSINKIADSKNQKGKKKSGGEGVVLLPSPKNKK